MITKITDSYIQAFNVPRTLQKNKYEFVYRQNDEIKRYSSNDFPEFLALINSGYLFTTSKKIPMISEHNSTLYKTNFENLSEHFIGNKDSDIILKIIPYINSNPKFVKELIYNLKDGFDKKDIIKEINKDAKTFGPTDIKTWYNYILNHCPMYVKDNFKLPYNFMPKFNNENFSKKITEKDISIMYDIHSENELNIVQDIESTFENLNQVVILHGTYDKPISFFIEKLNEHKIKYKFENDTIKLKYNGLMKLGLSYELIDFL